MLSMMSVPAVECLEFGIIRKRLGWATTVRERRVIGLHPKLFYDG